MMCKWCFVGDELQFSSVAVQSSAFLFLHCIMKSWHLRPIARDTVYILSARFR